MAPGRSKSARRRAELAATTSAAAASKHHTATRRSGVAMRTARAESKGAAKDVAKDTSAKAVSGSFDDEYDRVRSLNKRRRKR